MRNDDGRFALADMLNSFQDEHAYLESELGRLFTLLPCEMGEEHCRACDRSEPARCQQVMDAFLSKLMDYALKHFAHEERVMRKGLLEAYPDAAFAAHAEAHANLMQQLSQLIIGRPGQWVGRRELYRFIEGWLKDHIATHDRQLHDWLDYQLR